MSGAPFLVVPAPAKLNLFLHVTGRRADGYHLLESVMVMVDLADSLRLERRDDGRVVRGHAVPGVDEADDLCLRAAALLKARTGARQGVSIALDKQIPIGAGLGGGSSDAASVLLALNRLWDLDLSRAALMEIGVALGADVPFFLFGCNAHAAGIGEVLRPVTIPRMDVLIAAPDAGISTAAVFAAPGLARSTQRSGADAFAGGFGRNDLQPVAMAKEPVIQVALDALDCVSVGSQPGGSTADRRPATRNEPDGRPSRARMTGSGSAVFRIVAPGLAAGHPRESRDSRGFRVIRTRFLAGHPLREFVAK